MSENETGATGWPDGVAVVTGAASGIGAATARALRRRGVEVVGVDIDRAGLERGAGESEAATLHPFVADLSDESAVRGLRDFVADHFGSAAMLHNNAGILGVASPFLESTVANFDRLMTVNARSSFLVLRQFAELAVQEGRAMNVVNTASAAGVKGAPGLAAYAMSKAAVIGLTKTAAVELGASRIRVNAIAPGRVATPLVTGLESAVASREEAVADRPLARAAEPEEIASLALWLLSDESSFVTGAVYAIDGGLTA